MPRAPLTPLARELFTYNFANFYDDPDNAPQSLEDIDTDGDNVLEFDEAFSAFFVNPLQAFLEAFPDTKLIADGIVGIFGIASDFAG